jgi:hypothetical protein
MFQALCGVALACAVTVQPAEALEPPMVAPPPPPPMFAPPPPPVFLDQDEGCEAYNCIGPRTAFRLPDEVPYFYYEQQYFGLPPGM